MKKILALLMILALMVPTAAPAFAACKHPKDAIETEYGKMDVLQKPIDGEKHRTTIIHGEYKYCTLCDKVVSDWKEIEREVYEQQHEFDGDDTCWLCGYKPGSLKPSKVVLDASGTVTLPMGETLALDYTFEPGGASAEVKWSSSSKKIAVVDENGVVTPVKEGTATITVKTENGKKDTVKVKVVDPYKPTKVILDASGTVTLAIDKTLQLNASLAPETAKITLTWTTSSKKIATVDENGIVTPVKEGTATITVKTANGKKDTVKVKVVDPYKPTKVVLDKSGTVTLNMGETLVLNAALQPESAKSALKWTTSSKKIAAVDENGIVTPVKEGTATITVKTANGKKDTVKVKVVDPYKPTKVVLDKSGTVTLEMGQTLQLNAMLEPATAQSKLTWSTSSKKIATVDENGLVTATGKGTATITVKTANGKKDTVKVKVVGGENDYIELTKYLYWSPKEMARELKCKYYKGGLDYAGHYANKYVSIAADDVCFSIIKESKYSIYGIYVGMGKEEAEQSFFHDEFLSEIRRSIRNGGVVLG